MTRDEFDALVKRAVTALSADLPPANPGDPASLSERQDAIQEAQLLEAEASAFADAVDRDGKAIDYGSAVVLEGERGFVVVTAAEFERTPGYWRTVAGKLDRLVVGPELLPVLQAAANKASAH